MIRKFCLNADDVLAAVGLGNANAWGCLSIRPKGDRLGDLGCDENDNRIYVL